MKKTLLSLGTLAGIATPLLGVVSCDLGNFSEVNRVEVQTGEDDVLNSWSFKLFTNSPVAKTTNDAGREVYKFEPALTEKDYLVSETIDNFLNIMDSDNYDVYMTVSAFMLYLHTDDVRTPVEEFTFTNHTAIVNELTDIIEAYEAMPNGGSIAVQTFTESFVELFNYVEFDVDLIEAE